MHSHNQSTLSLPKTFGIKHPVQVTVYVAAAFFHSWGVGQERPYLHPGSFNLRSVRLPGFDQKHPGQLIAVRAAKDGNFSDGAILQNLARIHSVGRLPPAQKSRQEIIQRK